MTLSNPAQYISGRTVQEQMNSLIDYVDQRAADVALDAIASDVAQVHSDAADAHTDALAAAASAAAAAGTLANAVKKTGEASQSIAGDVTLSTGDLSVAGDAAVQGQLSVIGGCDLRAPVKIPVTPTNNDDAASKKYVDDHHDATKLSINDVNSYAVGLTGNQTNIAGNKVFLGSLTLTSDSQYASKLRMRNETIDRSDYGSLRRETQIIFTDGNDAALAMLMLVRMPNGLNALVARLYDKNGGYHDTNLANYQDTP